MTVGIVTDSTAALTDEIAGAHGIRVVPIWLSVGGRSYQDGCLDQRELLNRFDEGVSTSGPSPGEFQEAIAQSDGGEGALVLTVAGRFSGTYKSASVAAEELDNVRVIDTGAVAAAQALIVMAAADAAARGGSLDAVEAAARRAMEQVQLTATLDTLDYLIRSGRLPGVAGWVGRRTGLRPVVEFKDGTVRPLRPAFSREASIARVLARWRRSRVPDARLHVAALHALAPEVADDLLSSVREEIEPETAFISDFGSAMVAYTGPGVVGLAWRWDPTDGSADA